MSEENCFNQILWVEKTFFVNVTKSVWWIYNELEWSASRLKYQPNHSVIIINYLLRRLFGKWPFLTKGNNFFNTRFFYMHLNIFGSIILICTVLLHWLLQGYSFLTNSIAIPLKIACSSQYSTRMFIIILHKSWIKTRITVVRNKD